MTNKTIQIIGLVLVILSTIGALVGSVVLVAHYQGKIDERVANIGLAIADIKQQLRDLSQEGKVQRAIAPGSQHAETPAAIVVEAPAAPAPEATEDPPQWHDAYLRDHCKLCPTCCASAATGAP